MVPPISLIAQNIKHARYCNASGVLIVPEWKSATFWPMIHSGYKFRDGIRPLLEFRAPKNFFISGPGSNDVFTEKAFAGTVWVLVFKF